MRISYNEFHISKAVRKACNFEDKLYASTGNAIFADFKAVYRFQAKLNKLFEERGEENKKVSAGNLNAMGLIDEVFHYVCSAYRRDKEQDAFKALATELDASFGRERVDALLLSFTEEFPPVAVYRGEMTAEQYLAQTAYDEGAKVERTAREQTLEELVLLHLANENPAFHPFQILFDDTALSKNEDYIRTWNSIKDFFAKRATFGPKNNPLINMLKEPVIASPTSLKGQLDYIRTYWTELIGDRLKLFLEGIDTISEEEKAAWHPIGGAGPEMDALTYDDNLMKEYERFSPDRDWMPKVVLMAKTVLVWLYQLSKKYRRDISRLDQIPDEELDTLRDEGFTGLWLIGLWERSYASRRIKQINGNPEAASSAYSLYDYEIAGNLGGWSALENLRYRCWQRGIRLASDMVPNHTGMDGKWVIEHPQYFISTRECPFPQYTFTGENLSQDSRVSLYLEDHYYSKTDCAVCFKRVDNATGDTMYIYHGNDGTGMPWNDTAQIDFLNAEAREAVMQQIMKVARNFPIIRFDAAMVLAKKHIRRLWYPEPGHGGDIPTRGHYALSVEEFEKRMPNEFWREVVDRCAVEMPDTLLLAEAFWMMEGYFTRTLGMHRVYNSAFMNMLKKEENQKYRDTVKNTIKFDPEVLKRFVNFMNNPDEETAVAQFGKGDKYFGVCTLMVTMPGLPMFGHGQLEGFEEKYGMEYTRAYRDEQVDQGLLNRHWHDIFPLMHRRYLFAGVENFLFYDVWNNDAVNENVFAYSNSVGNERTIVFYNNKYERASGWIHTSCDYAVKTGSGDSDKTLVSRTLGEAMRLSGGSDHYMIFREHRSGLWYIRKSDDILHSGMYVSLNGFEYQVYLDIQEVTDDEEGKYSRLNKILNGAGTKDLDTTWEEYHYKEMYNALNAFITKDYITAINELFGGGASSAENPGSEARPEPPVKPVYKKEALSKLLRSVRREAIAFYEEADKVLNEEEKEVRAAKAPDAKESRNKAAPAAEEGQQPAHPRAAAGKYARFVKQVKYLYTAYFEPDKEERNDLELSIAKTLRAEPLKAVILCAAASVTPLGSASCLRWDFARKLSEALGGVFISAGNTKTDFLRIFKCLKIRELRFSAASFASSTYAVAKLLTADGPDAFALCGVNEFAGVKWFNKEKMEDTLWYALASNCMLGTEKSRAYYFRLYRALFASKELSEYKCRAFTEQLKPVKMTVRARRPATGKTTKSKKPPRR